MNKFKKVLVGVGIATLCLLSFSGCGKKTDDLATIDKDTIYKETDLKLPFEKNFYMNSLVVSGDKIIYNGYTYDDTTWESKNVWGTANADGSDFKQFTLNLKDGWVDYVLPLSNGKVAMINSEYVYDDSDPDNYVYESYFYLSLYNTEDGSVLNTIDLAKTYEIDYLSSAMVIGNDNIYIASSEKSLTFDGELNLVKEVNAEDNEEETYYNFYTIKDGSLVVSYWGDSGQQYARYDEKTGKIGDEVKIVPSTYNYSIYSGAAGYDFIFRDSLGVYGYNIGQEQPKQLLNFINSDISTSSFDTFAVLSDGSFLASYTDWDSEDYTVNVCRYTKVDPKDVKDKKVITLGCLYLDTTVRKNVLAFNKASDEYRIVIVDYSKYETEDDWEAGSNKFNTDIASGNGPDIICADGYQINKYQSKGVFLDLTDYLKNDAEINYDDIFPNLLEATSYNGKLYQIVPSFYVQTLVGKTSLIGNRTSWTFDEFNSFVKSLPSGMEAFSNTTRDTFLYMMLSANSAQYINMDKAEVYFDSQEFISLLEYLKTLPTGEEDGFWDDYDWEAESVAFRENKAALYMYTVSYVEDYLSVLKGQFGEDITFIGYPSSTGNGSSIYFGDAYAISSKCKYPEAAWQVIKYYLTKEYQDTISYGIPASISRFDSLLDECKKKRTYTDYDGTVYDDPVTYYMNGVSVELDPLTDAEAAKLKNFVLSVNKTEEYLDEIETIVSEEAAAFFEGQKSAAEVATIIQSRASIYIKEIQ